VEINESDTYSMKKAFLNGESFFIGYII